MRRLLPFHLVVDTDGGILQTGELLEPFLLRDGDLGLLLQHFEVERPSRFEADQPAGEFDWLTVRPRQLWILKHRIQPLRLKGAWEVRGQCAFFIANLWVTEIEQLRQLGLNIRQLPIYDHAVDHLLLLQQQQASIRDMRAITKNLAEARDQAQAASQAKTSFLASMSHEIRTPMNGIVGLADALYDTALTAHQQSLLDTISQSAARLMHIINDILDLSKVEAGELELRPEAMDVRREIEHVIQVNAFAAGEKGLQLKASVAENVPGWVEADPVRFGQVLSNLVSNALKFTPAGGQIRVEVDHAHGLLQVSVHDTGVGVSEENLEVIFMPFKQADEGIKRGSEGTGLGLAICRRIVELMQGTLTADSVPGQGSVFRFAFEPVVVPAPEIAADSVAQTFAGRCLIVDDNAVNLQVAKHMAQRAGLTTTTAADGAEALRRILQDGVAYDVVLMDCHMPVMDGMEAARQMRRAGAAMPIVALTADVMEEAEANCLQAGMDAVLIKPLRFDALARMLSQVLPSR